MIDVLDYLDEAVQNELNASMLYRTFSEYFPEDYNFWWKLFIEEQDHASILRSAKQFYIFDKIPFDISQSDLDTLKRINEFFPDIISNFKKNPTRKNAFDIALTIENTVGESHYQQFMSNYDKNDTLSQIFRKLNKEDINHEARIKKYIEENNIQ